MFIIVVCYNSSCFYTMPCIWFCICFVDNHLFKTFFLFVSLPKTWNVIFNDCVCTEICLKIQKLLPAITNYFNYFNYNCWNSKVSWFSFEIFCNSSCNRGTTMTKSQNSRDDRQKFVTEADSKWQQTWTEDNRNDSKWQQEMTAKQQQTTTRRNDSEQWWQQTNSNNKHSNQQQTMMRRNDSKLGGQVMMTKRNNSQQTTTTDNNQW